jgi:hypothetical protein
VYFILGQLEWTEDIVTQLLLNKLGATSIEDADVLMIDVGDFMLPGMGHDFLRVATCNQWVSGNCVERCLICARCPPHPLMSAVITTVCEQPEPHSLHHVGSLHVQWEWLRATRYHVAMCLFGPGPRVPSPAPFFTVTAHPRLPYIAVMLEQPSSGYSAIRNFRTYVRRAVAVWVPSGEFALRAVHNVQCALCALCHCTATVQSALGPGAAAVSSSLMLWRGCHPWH